MISLFKTTINTRLRKVVIVFRKGNFNLSSMLKQIFKVISLGEFPFEKWLVVCLQKSILLAKDLLTHRIEIIIELVGTLKSKDSEILPEEDQIKIDCKLECKLHYNLQYTKDEVYLKFMEQIGKDFERQTNHKINIDDVYEFKAIIVKVKFEKTGRSSK